MYSFAINAAENGGSFADNTAHKNEYIYYLLETKDKHNKISQTEIKMFCLKAPSKLILNISPNPITSHISIQFNSVKEGSMKVYLQDEKGNSLMQENMLAETGINNANLHLDNLLKPGIYYLVCILGTIEEMHKLIELYAWLFKSWLN